MGIVFGGRFVSQLQVLFPMWSKSGMSIIPMANKKSDVMLKYRFYTGGLPSQR